MASCLNLFFLSFLSALSISNSQISDSLNGVVFSVVKDLPTGQYIAQIHLGDSPEPVKLVVDLAGSIPWFDCSSRHVSSSRNLISGSSSGCLKAKVGNDRVSSSSRGDHQNADAVAESSEPNRRTSDRRRFPNRKYLHFDQKSKLLNADCELLVRNGAVGITARGELFSDVMSFGSPGTVDLLFACTPPWLLRGLASGAQGVMGLARAQISLPSQLAAETNERRRLTVFLSPLNGVVSTSSVEEVFGVAASRSLVYTPLLTDSSGNYVINVKSIRVNGKKLSVEGPLAAELSTVVPYTMLESSIYAVFAEAYAKAASEATSVAPVAPFGLCFTSDVEFPAVDLALQSEMVRWRIQGKNLMVDVGGGVRCLRIVDGGSSRVNPIVMGGLQLEGLILDFDLGNSMMGFGQRTRSDSASL